MRKTVRASACALVVAGAGVLAGPAAADNDGRSNMGLCSSYLGHLQVRDDVNAIIRELGDRLGIASPGELYSVRARQHENGPAEQECSPRQL
ncbi:MAG: hypothetical protein M3321_02430 [Actinomycetota bacterium]|nr:hypothetical protein [Actinomycetota bacterium]